MKIEKFYENDDYAYITFKNNDFGRSINIYNKDVDGDVEMYICDDYDITLYFTQENIKDLIDFLNKQLT